MILRKVFIFILTFAVFAALSGCMVNLGEEDLAADVTPNIPEDIVYKDNNVDFPTISAAIVDDSFNLNTHIIFSVSNTSNEDLRGIDIELSAGENTKPFVSIDASHAIVQKLPLHIHMPTNITENSIFVTLSGPVGRIREMHFVPIPSCVEEGGVDCNKMIVSIDSKKYNELKE